MNRKLATLLGVLAIAGCAHLDTAPGEVTYSQDARQNYEEGLQALDSGRHLDALKYFEHVRYKFPYSEYAALADLAIADTNFDREKYAEAIDGYRSFLKLHPNHPKADYAEFRIALSHYKDMPSSFILFPPPSQKDQSAVREANVALAQFLEERAGSQYAPEAQKLLGEVRRELAKHELYVADFYLHRSRWQAAVNRLNTLLQQYPGIGYDGEALFKLGNAYLRLDQKDKARETFERLVREHPDDPHAAQARDLLKSLS